MSPRQIIAYAKDRAMLSDKIAGKTPEQTMKSKLSVHIRKHASDSPFLRTAPGRFYLRELLPESHEEYKAPPLTPPSTSEQVTVFPVSLLDGDRFQGVTPVWKRRYRKLMNSDGLSMLPRLEAEANETYKQILTYVLVIRGGKVLAFRRGIFNRVEDMLKGARCIGFGGHVRNEDYSLFSTDMAGVFECARRELTEELRLSSLDKARLDRSEGLEIVGLLNDDSSDVGRRHFAVVLRFEVADPDWVPVAGEKSITQLRWIDGASEPSIRLHEFEYWSQLCFRQYFPTMLSVSPGFTVVRGRKLRESSILCLVGGVGSGKSEVADVLRDRLGYEVVNAGRVLATLLEIPPVPDTSREEFQERAFGFISEPDGPDRLASAIALNIEQARSARVLVDGIRQLATLELLRGHVSPRTVGIAYVQSSPDLAFRLYSAREGSLEDPLTFYRVVGAAVEGEVGDFLRMADGVLYNYFGKRDFRKMILRMFETSTSKLVIKP